MQSSPLHPHAHVFPGTYRASALPAACPACLRRGRPSGPTALCSLSSCRTLGSSMGASRPQCGVSPPAAGGLTPPALCPPQASPPAPGSSPLCSSSGAPPGGSESRAPEVGSSGLGRLGGPRPWRLRRPTWAVTRVGSWAGDRIEGPGHACPVGQSGMW